MSHNIYIYILVMAGVSYLIRMLPLTLIRKEIKNKNDSVISILCTIRHTGSDDLPGNPVRDRKCLVCMGALIVATALAWFGKSLLQVSVCACMVVFLLELFL